MTSEFVLHRSHCILKIKNTWLPLHTIKETKGSQHK